MITDSITTNASIASAPHSKDFGKKKRINRSAKLKQCKLDARREQWLSQVSVKSKGGCDDIRQPLSSMHKLIGCNVSVERSLEENLKVRESGGGIDGSNIYRNESDPHLSSLLVSNSPTSILLRGSESGTNFTSSGSSSSSGGCCSGNITEDEEDHDDVVLDDWETFADALATIDNKNNNGPTSPPKPAPVTESDPPCELSNLKLISACPTTASSRAWRSDDECRPQCLPNLSKQHSFPATDWRFSHAWAVSVPTSCPICCENLDPTDSTFLPCLCGFHLCLFCHKRILDEDGRCPGCRKPYKLERSCSMVARS
ncbi:hypothetical protein ACFE04_018746 [Oxalis oulophora]